MDFILCKPKEDQSLSRPSENINFSHCYFRRKTIPAKFQSPVHLQKEFALILLWCPWSYTIVFIRTMISWLLLSWSPSIWFGAASANGRVSEKDRVSEVNGQILQKYCYSQTEAIWEKWATILEAFARPRGSCCSECLQVDRLLNQSPSRELMTTLQK